MDTKKIDRIIKEALKELGNNPSEEDIKKLDRFVKETKKELNKLGLFKESQKARLLYNFDV